MLFLGTLTAIFNGDALAKSAGTGGNGFGVWALKAPVTESEEMALSLSAGGPLPRLDFAGSGVGFFGAVAVEDLLILRGSEAETDGAGRTLRISTTGELNFVRAFSRMNKVACGWVVKNDLPAGENAAVEGGMKKYAADAVESEPAGRCLSCRARTLDKVNIRQQSAKKTPTKDPGNPRIM